jgi:hypothetical protein
MAAGTAPMAVETAPMAAGTAPMAAGTAPAAADVKYHVQRNVFFGLIILMGQVRKENIRLLVH